MDKYDHLKIEKKWQREWLKNKLYDTKSSADKPKCYVLDMFPYPSGEGLHVGHPKGYIGTDIYSRYKRMTGHNVLHPMGWDAFGLPAENYAIKNKVHPEVAVKKNVKRYKEQLSMIGFDYDWEREINTTDPEYYKWTQWAFLKLFERGLAYESYEPIIWCPSCLTGLANEDLEDGKCERCGSEVERKPMRQWVLKITDYADRLLKDLDQLNWPESIKESQRNWIGRSEGAEIDFNLEAKLPSGKISVFTTRPDTLFGATYVVLAPEHELVGQLKEQIKNWPEVERYQKVAKNKSELDRTDLAKEKSGVKLEGVSAINPANNESLPIFIADYVLASYGTGAIMAVPAHDERDFEFAKKYKLPIREVIAGGNVSEAAHTGGGKLLNSNEFNGLDYEEAKLEITKFVKGKTVVRYKLRDWVFSRQRYWGEPIPIIHCDKCGAVPVPENDLPVTLPKVKSYEPTGTGESPLAAIDKWVKTTCPVCQGSAKRETNTMPQWAGSSWYYLRYIDPKNTKEIVDPKKEKYWQPVDMYVGGTEHATRHLIYARFWHKFLYDIGVASTIEPFKQLKNQGLIAGADGRKMSKRFGNVVNPDDVIRLYGADSFRLYEMFMGPFDQGNVWNTDNMMGPRRFIEKVWRIGEKIGRVEPASKKLETAVHKTIVKVKEDIEVFSFNTAISAMMILANEMEKVETVEQSEYETLLKLLAPFAPHVTEELWFNLGHKQSIHLEPWPIHDNAKTLSQTMKLAVQVNGKVRDTIEVIHSVSEEEVRAIALASPTVHKWIGDGEIKKFIYVKNRLVNIVI
jgi:leucyl-tRNA synthetase